MRINFRHKLLLSYFFLLSLASTSFQVVNAQTLMRNVLFLGNSYTYVNNLPQMISDFASSTNDTLTFQSNTPGGYTLDQHFADPNSTNKIIAGGWDYVVMQEQSQLPSFDQYLSSGPQNLSHLIDQTNPCAHKLFYMTWGRKNGDASNCGWWPPVCTYEGMDSLLYLRYLEMAMSNNAEVSPVGAVWRYIRQHYPQIDLYDADESHPSPAGTYAAAACFYAVIFKKDPSLSNFNHTFTAPDAALIKDAAKIVVFDSLAKWDFSNHQPLANFRYHIGNGTNEVIFTNLSDNSDSYLWDFGDGFVSNSKDTTHSYASNGNYTITLTAINCDLDTSYQSVFQKTISFCAHDPRILPDSMIICPGTNDSLWTQQFDSYQWLDWEGNAILNDTNQYLIPAGFNNYSVLTTLNNCTEQSPQVYVEGFNPGLIIYRVDTFSTSMRIDTLCLGDTLLLMLNPNKPDGASFQYQWYENGNPLAFETDDTLIVNHSGNFHVRVYNDYCPAYTYYQSSPFVISFMNCNIGIAENLFDSKIIIYPNPAKDHLIINNSNNWSAEANWKIVDISGRTVQSGTFKNSLENKIALKKLSHGIYFIDCKDESGTYWGKFVVE